MTISVFDLFKIGIGPSSSHTVGPMSAARSFVDGLQNANTVNKVIKIKVELFGSLGATGRSHGSPKAIILGLLGEEPETVNVSDIVAKISKVREEGSLKLNGQFLIEFDEQRDLILHRKESLPYHPNGMKFTALDDLENVIDIKIYYSIGGGFVVNANADGSVQFIEDETNVPFPFATSKRLLELAEKTGYSISTLMRHNELAWRSDEEIRERLLSIWKVMEESIEQGCQTDGTLPGGLKVKRRAGNLYRQLKVKQDDSNDPLDIMDWVTLFALAVNEENASGGRIVTAPTNGAAGIIPAVLNFHMRFSSGANSDDVERFLLTAAAIGILYKKNASISGAEVGCQGEVGSACSMAAGALTEVLGGTPAQVENAAEIAMEHNLGLTCDPIGGLVQVPCIERNAMGAIKAISASRMALRGNGKHFVSLDEVINTMRETGKDMKDKYKETARGGLATNVIEIPVNIVEC
ncbi:L-serine ammonia-lyase [Gammaproteobacteria bacterium]|nr:L-serine ammonia-lyase [Gammaproteobacteria bacterium]